jgi:hypothetical protein
VRRSELLIIPSCATTPHPQPKDRRMRKAAETPCKQRAFRDPPRIATGPLPDPFPSNTPGTRAAPATTNLPERLEHRARKRLGPFRDCTVGPGLPFLSLPMSVRIAIRTVLRHLGIAAACIVAPRNISAAPPPATAPSILIILTDDQGRGTRCGAVSWPNPAGQPHGTYHLDDGHLRHRV